MLASARRTVGKLSIRPVSVRRVGLKLIAFGLLFAAVWFLRPWLHGIIYTTVYSPMFLLLVGGSLLVALLLFFAPPIGETLGESMTSKGTVLGVAVGVLLVLSLGVGFIASPVEQRTIAEQTLDGVEIVDEPPAMNEDNPRIAPRAVSDVQTDGTLSYPQHQLGASDIARAEDGSLVWSYPIEPDQFRNQIQGNQIGLVHAEMTAMEDRTVQAYDEFEFTYGQNNRFWQNVEWQLKKQDGFWSAYQDDPYEFVHDGDAYMVYPKTGHEWQLTPFPHTTPTWDGVALVHEDGTIEQLSPEEAQERPELQGQRLYPVSNTKTYAESLEYREGILNVLPAIGQFENATVPASMPAGVGNDQPFVVDLEGEQMSYSYALEVTGGGTGLAEIWFFDAETGTPVMYDTTDQNVFGPERAVGIARGTDTQTEWGPDGEAMAVEPVLATVDGSLYWHIKVTTSDQTDVVRNIFVNADGGGPDTDQGGTAVMETTSAVTDFIAGDIDESELEEADDIEIEDAPDDTEDEDDDIAYFIVITDDDGNEVDRIPVEEGQETIIDTPGSEADDDDETGE